MEPDLRLPPPKQFSLNSHKWACSQVMFSVGCYPFLSVDLRGTSLVSHDQCWIGLGAKGQQGVGSPGRIFRLLSRFCLILWTFSPFLTTNRFLKTYLLWDVTPRCAAQGADPSVGPLSRQSKTLTCSYRATSFPGFSPTRPTERERDKPWKTLVTCLPESGRLQTNDLGKGQVSVRFVSYAERRQVSAAMKLCT